MAVDEEVVAGPRAKRRATPPSEPPVLPAMGVLLSRVVVVEGGRSAELVVGLTDLEIPARAVSIGALQTMIAGLIVFEVGEAQAAVRDALLSLRIRQGPVGVLMLAKPESDAIAELFDITDALLPPNAPVAAVAAHLRTLARLLAIDPPSSEPETVTIRNISIDLVHRHARVGGQLLELTPTEFILLSHLARKRGVATHSELFREVHGYGIAEREAKSILKVHIWRLRTKLTEALPGETPIVTVRGFGYLLDRRSGRIGGRREADRRKG